MDETSGASKTAMMVAAYRARATARPDPICRDPWAETLAGARGEALARAFDDKFAHMELWMALRTAYLDGHVRRWTGAPHRFGQVVVLGAGLDTRAARLAAAGVRFFEVDHPATQAHKRDQLAAADGYPVDAATYVPCDFERGDDFVDQLATGGFDPAAPAVVIWEGVTAYLTEPAVRATARRIATGMHERTILLFDHVGKRMGAGEKIRGRDRDTRDYVDDLGEPLRFGSDHTLPLLYDEGFRWVRQLTFDEICLDFTGSYAREREFRFQYISLASRTEPPGVL
jgi:methyltransferase (TIGR00027 family)